jgi:hypothetical protein
VPRPGRCRTRTLVRLVVPLWLLILSSRDELSKDPEEFSWRLSSVPSPDGFILCLRMAPMVFMLTLWYLPESSILIWRIGWSGLDIGWSPLVISGCTTSCWYSLFKVGLPNEFSSPHCWVPKVPKGLSRGLFRGLLSLGRFGRPTSFCSPGFELGRSLGWNSL